VDETDDIESEKLAYLGDIKTGKRTGLDSLPEKLFKHDNI
jgi:hypothetical protein